MKVHCGWSRLAALMLLAAGIVSPARAQTAMTSTDSRLEAARASGPISVDGALLEPAWASAPLVTHFRQVEPEHGAPSAFETVVWVLYDEGNLYIAAFCRDSLGRRGIRVQDLRRKFDYFENDLFGVNVDALHDGRTSVAFQITPYGTQRELQVYDGDTYNREWEGVWKVRTSIADSGWTAEIAIPWATLRYRDDGRAWGVNFYRIARRANETSAWRPWPRNLNAYRMDFAGELSGLSPPPPRANLRIRPYTLLRGERAGSAGARTEDLTPFLGGELTWAPSPNATLDLSARTDFAQAEVDRQVVNLSRFSVFFPERRQFFLENANLFTVGLEDQYVIQPFFSRRIGLSDDGVPIPIQGGARFVHRDPRSGAGALLIRQEGHEGGGPASFGVARYSRNLGSRSRVGGLVTARIDDSGTGSRSSRGGVAAADWFTRFGEQVTFNGMVSASSSSSAGGEGAAGFFFLGRQTDHLYTGLIEALVTEGYSPAMGFVSRPDVLVTSPAIIGDLRPAWRPTWVRNFKPAGVAYLYHDPDDLRLQEGFVQGYVDVVFRSGALIYPYLERHFQRPTEPFELLRGITVPAGMLDHWRYGFNAKSNASARISAQLDASWGGFFGGERDRYDLQVRAAPSPRAALGLRYEINRLRRLGLTRSTLTTHLVAPELRLAFDARTQLTAFYQYNSDIERGSWNVRFSYEFAPLSYVFLVYNDERRIGGVDRTADAGLPRQQLIVKLVYLRQL